MKPTQTPITIPQPQLGFSFSPGGMLLPYHLGVMDSLTTCGLLDETTPVAGSSAGAIAVATHACGLSSAAVLDATIALAAECQAAGGARGRLIPALRRQMQRMIGREQLERIQNRPGKVGIAYQQVLPWAQAVVQTEFDSLDDLIHAVSFSSTFPFFSDKWPVAVDTRQDMPRVVVDGFFTVPRNRLGCPDLNAMMASSCSNTDKSANNDNTKQKQQEAAIHEILVACFPQEKVRLTAVPAERCISPTEHAFDGALPVWQQPRDGSPRGMASFIQIAMETSPASTYFRVYEQGLADGEAWAAAAAARELILPSSTERTALN